MNYQVPRANNPGIEGNHTFRTPGKDDIADIVRCDLLNPYRLPYPGNSRVPHHKRFLEKGLFSPHLRTRWRIFYHYRQHVMILQLLSGKTEWRVSPLMLPQFYSIEPHGSPVINRAKMQQSLFNVPGPFKRKKIPESLYLCNPPRIQAMGGQNLLIYFRFKGKRDMHGKRRGCHG